MVLTAAATDRSAEVLEVAGLAMTAVATVADALPGLPLLADL